MIQRVKFNANINIIHQNQVSFIIDEDSCSVTKENPRKILSDGRPLYFESKTILKY